MVMIMIMVVYSQINILYLIIETHQQDLINCQQRK